MISVEGDGDFVEVLKFVFTFVLVEMSSESVSLRLRHRLSLNMVFNEISDTGKFVNNSHVIQVILLSLWSPVIMIRFEVIKYCWSLLVHVANEVFQFLFVQLEMLHDQVVRQAIPLVEVCPLVVHMVVVTINDSVDRKTIHV